MPSTSQKLRDQRFALGVCIDCKQPKEAERVSLLRCVQCAKRSMARAHESQTRLRADRRSKGLCIDCAEPNSLDTGRCPACQEAQHLSASKRHSRRKHERLCAQCGKALPVDCTTGCCTDCRAGASKRYFDNPEKCKLSVRRRNQTIKRELFAHYGNKCVVCPEARLGCLELDHINEDGADHRESLGLSRHKCGTPFYRLLLEQGEFPSSLQILCANCHALKHNKWENTDA